MDFSLLPSFIHLFNILRFASVTVIPYDRVFHISIIKVAAMYGAKLILDLSFAKNTIGDQI